MTITLTPDTIRDAVRVVPSGLDEVKRMSAEELRAELYARRTSTSSAREDRQRVAVAARSAEAATRLRSLGN